MGGKLVGKSLILALAFLVATPLQVRSQTEEGSWISRLKLEDWSILTLEPSIPVIVLTKFAPPENGHPKIWVRTEYGIKQPGMLTGENYMSMLDLEEIDCDLKKYRILVINLYKESNLQDSLYPGATFAPKWAYALPGTQGELTIHRACVRAGSRKPKH